MQQIAERITGLILAGGQGSRLGGRDKGLILLGDKSLSARAVARFAPQVDQLLLNANRNEAAYAALGHPVIGDMLYAEGLPPAPRMLLHASELTMPTEGLQFECPPEF